MEFIEYINTWSKNEVSQGRIMIGFGIAVIIVVYSIFRSQNELLKGMLIPLYFLILVLIGYGSYILNSRPAHVTQSIALYEKSEIEAIEKEKEKHINDNKAGKNLMRYVYPTLMFVSVIVLLLISAPYYKGIALGFVLLFVAIFIIDNGFVSRSNAFITYLNELEK